jgi:hypothetical protein
LASVVSTGELAGRIPRKLAVRRYHRGRNPGRLRDSGFPCLCGTGWLASQVGVYGYLLGGLGYALLGSSRQLAIGPTSAISLMIAGTVGAMAEGDVQRYELGETALALFKRAPWRIGNRKMQDFKSMGSA